MIKLKELTFGYPETEYRQHLITAIKQDLDEKIKKVEGGWAVYSSKGGSRLGTHPTKKKALKQLAAIEINKRKK